MSKKVYNTRSKSKIGGKNLRLAVDEVLEKYCKFEPEFSFFAPITENFTNENKVKDEEKCMKHENTVMTEINSELWDKALVTCLTDITATSIPHYNMVQTFINYTLNVESLDFGLMKTFFSRLLLFHPPNTPAMQTYYWYILNNKYVTLNNADNEDENIFWCVIEALTSCLENPECLADIENEMFVFGVSLSKEKSRKDLLLSNKEPDICFEFLSSSEKFQRVLLILEYLYEVLEADFVHRMRANQLHIEENRCFLSHLLWVKVYNVGAITSTVRKLIHFFQLMEQSAVNHVGQVHRKLLTLLAEIIRFNDRDNNFYPFFGNSTNDLASQLSLKLFEDLTKNYKPENLTAVSMIRPHWLRLLVCSKLLSYITCKQCSPELSAVHNILEDVISLNTRSGISKAIYENKDRETGKRRKNEGGKFFNLRVQRCYSGCTIKQWKESKRIKMTETDINECDSNGWAPLHRAVLLGHEKCVEKILNYQPISWNNEAADTKLQGFKGFTPLMCAALKERGNICRLLLEHSGPALLEDSNVKGDTAFDMCQDKDIGRIIKSSETDNSSLGNCKKFYLTSNDLPLVAKLCVLLVESYFITHRTRDVLVRSKICRSSSEDLDMRKSQDQSKKSNKWDYVRYENDINVNLINLSELMKQFIGGEIEKILEPLNLILNYDTKF